MQKRIAYAVLLLVAISLLEYPISIQAEQQETKTILIDYSHGQDNSNYGKDLFDPLLFANLSAMGYEVIIATGGLNSTILAGTDGFLLGSIRGVQDGFSPNEITAVADWFAEGYKFLWVAYDSDYPDPGGPFIHGNATLILEAVRSHVYGEHTHIWDNELHCGAYYRPIANVTSDNPYIVYIVKDVDAVLMHGATCLYGSASEVPSSLTNPVPLENTTIEYVTPFLYYSPTAYIHDSDDLLPIAHNDGDRGSFVACTFERNAGTNQSGVIVVSGSSPYGSYCPMSADHYYNWTLNGYKMILQAIDFGMNFPPTTISFESQFVVIGLSGWIIFMAIVLMNRKQQSRSD
ncbi:hypothetical protein EU528_14685 [Candidatus Thorarchaeota archaeon]|nr:MAG: hypothetical protein EU528_14685 [Candidatus Thorarchaeota archaeon]